MSYKTKQLYEMSVLRHRQQCMILPNNQLISGKKIHFDLKFDTSFYLQQLIINFTQTSSC